jgi:6-phosphogluconolactonase
MMASESSAAEDSVLVHESDEVLAAAVAARLVTRLVDIQASGGAPSLVLTGGSIAERIAAAVADSPARSAVDWRQVDFWWGDERFVPADDPDRNAGRAAAAMLDRLPVDPSRVHVMPASDGEHGDDVDAAAAAYAEELATAVAGEPAGRTVSDTGPDAGSETRPLFDILMLGIGPDGHCASLFPGRPEVRDERPVVAVRDSPKPPPTRISLTLGPLNRASEVWWVASGSGKADAVSSALSGADPVDVPAAGPRGLVHTLWFLDREAAARN